jgi:hypothetical protein
VHEVGVVALLDGIEELAIPVREPDGDPVLRKREQDDCAEEEAGGPAFLRDPKGPDEGE